MKHVFILNPAAGQGKALNLYEEILRAGEELGIEVEIYETKETLDGEIATRNIAREATKENPIRIYACGGDGTINEVLNGLYGYDNVELSVLPMGTGNDFIRNFGSYEEFMDIKAQLLGESHCIDVIKYKWKKNGYHYERYFINMINIGFDCNVVDAAGRMKKLPGVSGSMAYIFGVLKMLIKKKGANLKVEFDDGEIFDGELLLIAIANGCFCGGGVKGVPKALTDDGLLDVSLVKKCTRTNFVKLFPKYKKGTHLETKLAEKLLIYKQSNKLKITANHIDMMFSSDGELTHAEEITFEVIPRAIKFSVPKRV